MTYSAKCVHARIKSGRANRAAKNTFMITFSGPIARFFFGSSPGAHPSLEAASESGEVAVGVPEGAVLHLQIEGGIAERPNEVDQLWAELLDEPAPLSLYELTEAVRGARLSDGQVTAIWLDLGSIDARRP